MPPFGARVLLAAAVGLLAVGCRSKVATLRDALIAGDDAGIAAAVDVPTCKDAGCLDSMARALGAKAGFSANDPDQASAAAVAIAVARDHRGDVVPDADRWIAALGMARGYGADALRIAVAREMARVAPSLAKAVDEASAAKAVRDMAGALPGACEAYLLLDPGAAPAPTSASAAKTPDKSPCVKRDLSRRDGPGDAYGVGVWRVAAAAFALWKDEARALRAGLSSADPIARASIEAKLAVIEAATSAASMKPR
jgi:hypothetical protein